MSFRRIDFGTKCPLKKKLTKCQKKKEKKAHTKTAYVARGQKQYHKKPGL